MTRLTPAQRYLLHKIQREQDCGREGYLVANWNEERAAMALSDRGLIQIVRYVDITGRPGSFQSRPFLKIMPKEAI